MTFGAVLSRNKYYLLALACLGAGAYREVLTGLVAQWYQDPDYSHGFIVPLLAGYFVYRQRASLHSTSVIPWNPGLLVLVFGLLQWRLGILATEYFTMRTSLIIVLAGTILFLFGKAVFRRLLLALGYLILMIPLPYILYDELTFPLRLFVTRVSVVFLKLIGIAVSCEGNLLVLPNMTLEVADACSGLRSLVSLLAIGITYALILRTTAGKRLIIIAATVPIALLANSIRVIVTGILTQYLGAVAAEGFDHEFAGMVMFVLAILLLMVVGGLTGERVRRTDSSGSANHKNDSVDE